MGHKGPEPCLELPARFVFVVLLFKGAVSSQIRWSVAEEQKDGTLVGNFAKEFGIDPTVLREREFRILSASGESRFTVNPDDGGLYVNGNIDREVVCKGGSSCVVNLKIALENPLEIHYLTIEIVDMNDNSPLFVEEKQYLEIWESSLPGVRFQLRAARDPDSGINSIQNYKLSQNDHFRLEVKDRDDSKIPFLILQKQLDRELIAKVKLIITAVDGGKPPRSGTMEIIINVLDINDNAPVFTADSYNVVLDENVPTGTTVMQVIATDPDEGLNGEVVYSIGSSINNKFGNLFEITPVTGEIIVKGLLDFEVKDKYEIDIHATDKGLVPMTSDKTVTIKIADVNDNAPEIDVTSFSSTIPEDSRSGTTVALISVSDSDSGINGKISCSVLEAGPFKLISLHENVYSLVTAAVLDREIHFKYNLILLAKDKGEPTLSSLKTLTVQVSDVNDNNPEFLSTPYMFYILENNVPGKSLFSVSAFDRDSNENAMITYHMGTENHQRNAVLVNVNSDNGEIYALKSFDFENTKAFQFFVIATDSGTPSLSTNVTVNVFILDQNDNAPVIIYPSSFNGSATGLEEVPQNVNAGYLVTKLRAYDADIGYNGWLLFSLIETTDHSLFGLDRYTGQIRSLRLITEKDATEHKLIILVKDNGNISLSVTATVIIKVVEPKESFLATNGKIVEMEDGDNRVTFYLIITLGSISGLFVISIIVLILMQWKTPDNSTKYLQDTNYDGTLCHSIQYRSGEKQYMLVGPRMSIGSTTFSGSNGNTLVVQDCRKTFEVRTNKVMLKNVLLKNQ